MSISKSLNVLAKITKDYNDLELKQEIINLQREVHELIDENRNLIQEIRKMKESKKIEDSLLFDSNFYFIKKEGDLLDGPFCSVCWDKGNDLVRSHVIEWETNQYIAGCPIHGKDFDIDSHLVYRVGKFRLSLE